MICSSCIYVCIVVTKRDSWSKGLIPELSLTDYSRLCKTTRFFSAWNLRSEKALSRDPTTHFINACGTVHKRKVNYGLHTVSPAEIDSSAREKLNGSAKKRYRMPTATGTLKEFWSKQFHAALNLPVLSAKRGRPRAPADPRDPPKRRAGSTSASRLTRR